MGNAPKEIREVGIDRTPEDRSMHDELLRQAALQAKPAIVPPSTSRTLEGDGTVAGNPTPYVVLLSPVLAGEKAFEDIVINDAAWYADNGITLHAGHAVDAIDRQAKMVRAGSIEVPYDRLILAVGSEPIRLPLPGADLAGVVTFRDLDDVEAMIAAAKPYLVIDYPDSIEAQSSHWSPLPVIGDGSFNSVSIIPMDSVHQL